MTRDQYIRSCLDDIIDALRVADLPMSIPVGSDFIYPKVALERAKAIRDIDKNPYFNRSK